MWLIELLFRPAWGAVLLAMSLGVDVTVMHGYALLASSLRRWLPYMHCIQNHVSGSLR